MLSPGVRGANWYRLRKREAIRIERIILTEVAAWRPRNVRPCSLAVGSSLPLTQRGGRLEGCRKRREEVKIGRRERNQKSESIWAVRITRRLMFLGGSIYIVSVSESSIMFYIIVRP